MLQQISRSAIPGVPASEVFSKLYLNSLGEDQGKAAASDREIAIFSALRRLVCD